MGTCSRLLTSAALAAWLSSGCLISPKPEEPFATDRTGGGGVDASTGGARPSDDLPIGSDGGLVLTDSVPFRDAGRPEVSYGPPILVDGDQESADAPGDSDADGANNETSDGSSDSAHHDASHAASDGADGADGGAADGDAEGSSEGRLDGTPNTSDAQDAHDGAPQDARVDLAAKRIAHGTSGPDSQSAPPSLSEVSP